MFLALGQVTYAQDPVTQTPAPPPMRFIPREDRDKLAAAKDAKQRVRTSIALADTHLVRAEEYTGVRKHDSALIELGHYMGLVDDAMVFLSRMKRDSGRTRDLYKRLELALRAQGIRLAAIRRLTPAEYASQIKGAEDCARESRTKALESFYSQTVAPEETKQTRTEKREKDAITAGGAKRP